MRASNAWSRIASGAAAPGPSADVGRGQGQVCPRGQGAQQGMDGHERVMHGAGAPSRTGRTGDSPVARAQYTTRCPGEQAECASAGTRMRDGCDTPDPPCLPSPTAGRWHAVRCPPLRHRTGLQTAGPHPSPAGGTPHAPRNGLPDCQPRGRRGGRHVGPDRAGRRLVYVAGSEWEADRLQEDAGVETPAGTRRSGWWGSDWCPAGVGPAAGPAGRRT